MINLRYLWIVGAYLVVTLLPGCGFQLRGNYVIPEKVKPTYVQAPSDSLVALELERALRSAGVPMAGSPEQARAVLRLRGEKQDRRLGAVDANGKVIESVLIYSVEFDMVDAEGNEMVARQKVNLVRNQVNPDIEVLGKEQEQELFFQDMRRELVGLMLARLRSQLK